MEARNKSSLSLYRKTPYPFLTHEQKASAREKIMIAFWPGQYSCAGKAADLSTGISAAYSHFQGGKPSGFT